MKQPYTPRKANLWMLISLLLMTGAAMLLLRQCSHSAASPFASDYVKSQGDTLDVAIELNPACYSVSGDSIFGRDYEILRRISAIGGRPIKFHPFVPLKYALDGLDAGRFDIVVASMPLTSALRDRYLMTDPVYLDRQILVQHADSLGETKITSATQLGGRTVWIPADSPIATRLENLADEIGDSIHVVASPVYSAEQLFILAAKGEIPAAVVNEEVARRMTSDYPEADVSTPVSLTQFQAWALRKDATALADSINNWLRRVKH